MKALPFDQREGYIWYDGRFVEWQQANVHIMNHGLQYGTCVFEGERAYNGKVFKSEAHTKRLISAARFLDIEIQYTEEEINLAKQQLITKQNLKDVYVRMFAWKGCDKMTIESMGGSYHFAIAAWEIYKDYLDNAQEKGIRICTATRRRPDPETFPVQIKFSGA